MYLVTISLEVGCPGAAVGCESSDPSRRLYGWLKMNGISARMMKLTPGAEVMVSDLGAELATGVVYAFEAWNRAAVGTPLGDDTLEVLGAGR